MNYDKEKYREMLIEAAETVLGYFGFDRTMYDAKAIKKKNRKWWDDLRQERRWIFKLKKCNLFHMSSNYLFQANYT